MTDDDEEFRLKADVKDCHAEALAPLAKISHPSQSLLWPEYLALKESLLLIQTRYHLALVALRKHNKARAEAKANLP